MATVTPYLCVSDAAAAIGFYQRAFGAAEEMRMTDASGKVGHAEITIGTARIFVADEWPDGGVYGPGRYGGTPVSLVLQVDDVDAVFERAVAAGATVERPVTDQPYGERSGWLIDPFGHWWSVATTIEELSRNDLRERVGAEYDVT